MPESQEVPLVAHEVDVSFTGKVVVEVPRDLPAAAQLTLARHVALANVMATVDNPDNAAELDAVAAQFSRETGFTAKDFDKAIAQTVAGEWEVHWEG